MSISELSDYHHDGNDNGVHMSHSSWQGFIVPVRSARASAGPGMESRWRATSIASGRGQAIQHTTSHPSRGDRLPVEANGSEVIRTLRNERDRIGLEDSDTETRRTWSEWVRHNTSRIAKMLNLALLSSSLDLNRKFLPSSRARDVKCHEGRKEPRRQGDGIAGGCYGGCAFPVDDMSPPVGGASILRGNRRRQTCDQAALPVVPRQAGSREWPLAHDNAAAAGNDDRGVRHGDATAGAEAFGADRNSAVRGRQGGGHHDAAGMRRQEDHPCGLSHRTSRAARPSDRPPNTAYVLDAVDVRGQWHRQMPHRWQEVRSGEAHQLEADYRSVLPHQALPATSHRGERNAWGSIPTPVAERRDMPGLNGAAWMAPQSWFQSRFFMAGPYTGATHEASLHFRQGGPHPMQERTVDVACLPDPAMGSLHDIQVSIKSRSPVCSSVEDSLMSGGANYSIISSCESNSVTVPGYETNRAQPRERNATVNNTRVSSSRLQSSLGSNANQAATIHDPVQSSMTSNSMHTRSYSTAVACTTDSESLPRLEHELSPRRLEEALLQLKMEGSASTISGGNERSLSEPIDCRETIFI